MKKGINTAETILKKLAQDEKLLWCGHPYGKTHISISDIYRMSVGVLWCAANLFMLFNFYLKQREVQKLCALRFLYCSFL